ncbi:MAG: hypothetical protein P8Y07_06330 [Gemmatimonadales bacterium]
MASSSVGVLGALHDETGLVGRVVEDRLVHIEDDGGGKAARIALLLQHGRPGGITEPLIQHAAGRAIRLLGRSPVLGALLRPQGSVEAFETLVARTTAGQQETAEASSGDDGGSLPPPSQPGMGGSFGRTRRS